MADPGAPRQRAVRPLSNPQPPAAPLPASPLSRVQPAATRIPHASGILHRPGQPSQVTAVRVMRLADVAWTMRWVKARDIPRWRNGGLLMSSSGARAEMRQALGDPLVTVGDDTLVVVWEFRLMQN